MVYYSCSICSRQCSQEDQDQESTYEKEFTRTAYNGEGIGNTIIAIWTLKRLLSSQISVPQKSQANAESLKDSWRLTGLQSLLGG